MLAEVIDHVIETAATTVWFEDGIVHIRTEGIPSTAQTVTDTFDAVSTLTGDVPYPVLADARHKLPAVRCPQDRRPTPEGRFQFPVSSRLHAAGCLPHAPLNVESPTSDVSQTLTFLASRSSDA